MCSRAVYTLRYKNINIFISACAAIQTAPCLFLLTHLYNIMCVGVGTGANICPKNTVLSPILVVKTVKNRRNLRFLAVILLDVLLF